jgi:ATP-dependent Clp protease ATP-binding subunit ClpA
MELLMIRLAPNYSLGYTFLGACEEAKRRGDPTVGSEHLLLAVLADPDALPAQALGFDLRSARAALDAMDEHALATVGIDARVRPPLLPRPRLGRIRLTPSAKAVLQGSVKQAEKRRNMGPQHVLLALLERERPDPAAELFASLGVDVDAVRERLRAPDVRGR